MESGVAQPEQRLKRLDDPSGSSAGWWAIREWPGLVVAKLDKEWSFHFQPQALWPSSDIVTLEEIERSEWIYHRYRLHSQSYPTRRAALQALLVLSETLLGA